MSETTRLWPILIYYPKKTIRSRRVSSRLLKLDAGSLQIWSRECTTDHVPFNMAVDSP